MNADDIAGEFAEGHVDIGAALVAHVETVELREPGKNALDHPEMATQLLAALDAAPGYTGDGASPALLAATLVIVGLIGV